MPKSLTTQAIPQSMPTPGPSESAFTVANSQSAYRDENFRFLGPTSFAAAPDEGHDAAGMMTEPFSIDKSRTPSEATADRINEGADLLAMLSDMPAYTRLMKRWFALGEVPLVSEALLHIWFVLWLLQSP